LFNGFEENDPAKIASICSFVRQDDSALLPALTARETLHYAAHLRLPAYWSKEEKEARAEEVLGTLGLRHCADTVVGNELLKGLSGGEKRRLSIGVQMLTDPSVLVIDEPTSGLDAFTAHHIMVTLKHIAEAGRTIICSIHQPRSDIFAIFDNIIILTNGGRIAFAGPNRKMVKYFSTMGHELPLHTNPSDFILDLCSIDLRSEEAEKTSRLRVEKFNENWQEHKNELPFDSIDELEEGEEEAITSPALKSLTRNVTPFYIGFPALLSRSFLNTRRQPMLVASRVLQVAFLGVIQAMFYARQGYGQVSVQNRIGVIQQTVSTLYIGLLNCVAVFPAERDILFHERADDAYTVEPAFLAYNLIEVRIHFILFFINLI
jgi:ABC-type multidrug transport system ATPase subunit